MACKLGIVFVTLLLCSQLHGKINTVARSSTSLAREDQDNHLLLLSTLDGSLYAVDRHTGITQWQLKDEPAVKVPVDASKAVNPIFLPDPKDGSLYVFGGSEALKKLPFTIPQLVAQSPCRSSDGILYTGKKMDTWFTVDPKTGFKQPVLSSDGDHVCPLTELDQTNSLFIGRTEYNIIMLDSKKKERKWNVTFFDYSANAMDTDLLSNYEMVHFMGSSSGRVITMDRRTHTHLWSGKYESPVIGVYILDSEGLISCPFTSVAEETLDAMVVQLKSPAKSTWLDADQLKLKSTLYVGEHPHGLYALPSLVDQSVVTVKHLNSPLLLEGPEEVSVSDSDDTPHSGPHVKGDNPSSHGLNNLLPSTNAIDVAPSYPYAIILGHYQAPSYSEAIVADSQKTNALISLPKPILTLDWELENETDDNGSANKDNVGPNSKPNSRSRSNSSCWDEVVGGNFTALFTSDCIQYAYSGIKMCVSQQENKSLKVAMAFIIISMAALFCYVRGKMREIQSLSQGSRVGRGFESDSGLIPQSAESIGGGTRVGKITFFTNEILGKGCEGTFVYRGLFDGRNVAVKRLLPECFSLADREVALLRESDQHANVVRYFCTEQDHLFRYIALELAAATVADLVEGRVSSTNGILLTRLSTTEILRQAMLGLSHLHSLDIVHRDIKPQNVLLSVPNVHGEIRAMISDFGLCKKLQKGRMSFSRRSGIAGTDGWIAPEMLSGSGRTTCSVDIFSMGCVFYYVKTSGKHPFGDPLRRQANILSGDSRLNDLVGSQVDQLLTGSLVKSMLSWEPLERPPAEAVLAHPLFWSKAKIMSFFQDVSDRVEKDDASTSTPLQALETDGARVVRGDWRVHICDEVAQDLRRYRNYRGLSVRDLLRALRNKKHHYRELSLEAQTSLGTIPDQFVMYWMDRFPRLLLHSWLSMQIVRHEPVFRPYYHMSHTFSQSQIVVEADQDWETIVPPEGGNLNSVSWQVSKDKSSPKYKRKLTGANKRLGSKESPKRDTYPTNRSNDDDGYIWSKRNVTSDKKMVLKPRTENWRNPNSFLSTSEKSCETTDHQT